MKAPRPPFHAIAALLIGFMALSGMARAEVVVFDAPQPPATANLVIYSTLDAPRAAPLVAAFQAQNPRLRITYEDMLAADIAARVLRETDAGQQTADFVFSSGMDLQIKLANDGYGQRAQIANMPDWPDWANWQDTAFALTFEPAVLVYHQPSFPDGPPKSRLELMQWLRASPAAKGMGKIGTYDIEASAVGYLYLARDSEHFADIWSLVRLMGAAGVQVFPTSQDIIARVSDGRLSLGYNILGSYAAEQARLYPDLGFVLLRDFTVVVSRVGLVPRAAARPDLGAAFLAFLMGAEGQTIMSQRLNLPAISPEVQEGASVRSITADMGAQLRPVAVSPGLLAYLDQAKRRRILAKWREALGIAAQN